MSVAASLPGTSGHYFSTPDVNLLDADTAHLIQSTGLWTAGAVSTEQAYFGNASLKVLGGVSTAITPATDAAAMGVRIYSPDGDTFDINAGTPVVVPAGVWTVLDADAGNAGTYTVNAAGAGDYYVDAAYVAAVGGFVPSLRIVGDLDLRAKLALNDWTTGITQTILDNWQFGTGGFRLSIGSDGSITLQGDGASGAISESISDPGFVDGSASTIRVTTTTAGAVVYYLDGAQVGLDTFTAQAWAESSIGYWVGAVDSDAQHVAGDVYWVEVRDGIDGPVVARFDAADWVDSTS